MNLKKLHNDIHEGALQLMAEHRVQLFARAKSICGNDIDADELVVRTIDQAIRRIDSYSGEGDILSWMMSILVNLHNNDHRKPVVRGTTAVEAEELERYAGADWSTDEQLLKNSDSEAIRAAIAELDPKYNQVLMMRYYDEFSLKQIAAVLQLPLGTVSRRMQIAHRIISGKLAAEFSKVKPKLALLGAFLLAGSLFGAAAWGIAEAFTTPETPSPRDAVALELGDTPAEESPCASNSTAEAAVIVPTESSAVTIQPPPRRVAATPAPATLSTTENTNTKEKENMNLKSIIKSAAKLTVGAALTTGFAANANAGDLYVAVGGTGDGSSSESPLGTIAAAITAANAAIDAGEEQVTIHVATGTYTEKDLSLTKAISVVGEGDSRDAVIVQPWTTPFGGGAPDFHRVFRLSNSDAMIANMTVRHGWWRAAAASGDSGLNGGNVLIDGGGTVANCVIDSGYVARVDDATAVKGALGGNVYLHNGGLVVDSDIVNGLIWSSDAGGGGCNVAMVGGGRLLRCRILDGYRRQVSPATPNANAELSGGSGVYMNGSCIVENCLIQGNSGSCGAVSLYDGAPSLVNCTVVGNSGGYNGKNGVYVNSSSARVVNCVIYGNGGTANSEWSGANAASFINCAVPKNAEIDGGTGNVVATDLAFVNYSAQDYRPSTVGESAVLYGTGTSVEDYATFGGTSETDLSGQPRCEGDKLDIGCFATARSLSVRGVADVDSLFTGGQVSFSASSNAGEAQGDVTYHWDFGDGQTLDTTDERVAHRYDALGQYRVTVSGSTMTMTSETYEVGVIVVYSTDMDLYVAVGGKGDGSSSESPLGTIAAAITSANEFLNGGGRHVTIRLAAGTYTENNLSLEGDISVVGEGATRDDVIVQAWETLYGGVSVFRRTFRLAHERATIANLTVRYGMWRAEAASVDSGANGGNVLIYGGGTVTNCVIDSGYVAHVRDPEIKGALGGNICLYNGGLVVDSDITNGIIWNQSGAGGGGNVAMVGGGRLQRCRILGAIRRNAAPASPYPTVYSEESGGAGVYMNGSCVVENCLIQGNSGSCGAVSLFAGDPSLINCTIVGNSGGYNEKNGVYVNSSSARVVNCVIYGNGGTANAEWCGANDSCFSYCAFPADCTAGLNSQVIDQTAFVDFSQGDYHVFAGGPLVRRGSTTDDYAKMGAVSELDLDGNPRAYGTRLDIGCYELLRAKGLQLIFK